MRLLVQRAKYSKVRVEGKTIAEINCGLLVLVGIGKEDNEKDVERLSAKLANLRIFEDEQGKMNLNTQEVRGEILSVPQFTLYAETKKGNRPGFDHSANPRAAQEYWEKFNEKLKNLGLSVKQGVFGAHMEVELVNDGPVTIWLDSKE